MLDDIVAKKLDVEQNFVDANRNANSDMVEPISVDEQQQLENLIFEVVEMDGH